ncbi:MAG: hypothetical protein M5U10_07055 [Candidatus Methanoperedens sp.]|uniref:hypothetical protein n=1 Tax=Candidatus Methanoperedens nitratireducens TaxID=1392998 RepID=UPI0012FEC816|nr:hypothetical protein [Candidatus Methanoperedens nitroreducens]MDJ1421658.1 hypothetical protein [Candidatus Methanoperedens sp.]
MRLILDSDVLVHALRFPKEETLLSLHKKASQMVHSMENRYFIVLVIWSNH